MRCALRRLNFTTGEDLNCLLSVGDGYFNLFVFLIPPHAEPITYKDAPENQYPILGSDYTIRCEVTANPTPTVTWLRNGDIVR